MSSITHLSCSNYLQNNWIKNTWSVYYLFSVNLFSFYYLLDKLVTLFLTSLRFLLSIIPGVFYFQNCNKSQHGCIVAVLCKKNGANSKKKRKNRCSSLIGHIHRKLKRLLIVLYEGWCAGRSGSKEGPMRRHLEANVNSKISALLLDVRKQKSNWTENIK